MRLPESVIPDMGADGIPADVLRLLYRTMLRIQKVELRIADLYGEDEMKTPVHLCLGQEAVAAGVCASLTPEDFVLSNHRGHGHYIAKGGDMAAMVAELYNRETGCSRGRGGSMHLVDTSVGIPGTSSIVGGCVPIATGAALAAALRGNDRVSVAFFGDAAAEQGAVYESISFAVLKRLPVIFVCENNTYSVFSHISRRQAAGGIYLRFQGLSLPCHQVDGNDVVEVYRVAREAIANARRGGGPSFIECLTYRLRDHHGAGDGVDVGYRAREEVDGWAARCPVRRIEAFLLSRGLAREADIAEVGAAIDREVDEAFSFARRSPFPNPDELHRHLYG